MPLFRGRSDPETSEAPVLTVNGRRQTKPEATGSFPRRYRLFIECERRLADDPLVQPNALGSPLGDDLGLEGLVAKVAPLFEREPSIARWVALRGAFTELHIRVFEEGPAAQRELESAMGLEWSSVPGDDSHPDIALPWRARLSAEQRQAVIGIASSVLVRVDDYPRYEGMDANDVIADQRCSIPRAVALDCIAWSAAALLRLDIAQQLFSQVPEPDALAAPGWYTEPLFAKAQRYWDGSDWTRRCRVPDGRQFREIDFPLA